MVGYKLSKNDWVTPFFVIFRSVREILLVTVFCKHPVPPIDLSSRLLEALRVSRGWHRVLSNQFQNDEALLKLGRMLSLLENLILVTKSLREESP